jgi:HicB-like protein involved in pilus formation
MTKPQLLLKQAEEIAKSVSAWADLSNALFSPDEGILVTAFPTRAERQAFMKTDEFRKIRALLRDVTARTGLVEGATPRKSGKFVVRLPESLHAALEREARAEGVSLNQLVVAKLAVQLKDATRRKRQAS